MPGENTTASPLVGLLSSISSQWGTSTSVTAILVALSIAFLSTLISGGRSNDKVYDLGGVSIITAWTFFTKRYDFLRGHFKATGEKIFRFRVLQHRVYALKGEQTRKVFFTDQGLDMKEGYRILMGGAPVLDDINVKAENDDKDGVSGFVKRLLLLLRKDRVTDVLPVLLEDVNRRMKGWGAEGKINPFKEVYDLVFQMTVRMATCRELSEDQEAIDRLTQHYWDLEKAATPVALLLPWFPGPAKKAKEKATMDLYLLISSYVDLRRKASTPSMDPIDILIQNGYNNETIIGTILGIVFAGVINTGMNSCWALLYLGANPTWKQKAADEYKALVDKYTNTLSTEPLYKRLSTIPLHAWEDELPSMDLIIRETLRLSMSGTALRRNLGEDITIGHAVIKRGDFLAYSTADVHLNPSIYSNPATFDPERYNESRQEDRKEHFGYVGWGVGRHPCAGMKIAKLEMKLVLAMLLLGYDYELVNGAGQYPKSLPEQDRNDIQQARPLGDPCYLKFKRTAE
ncbi:cytochrome P450 [Crassisporium funariophilum]|nr:cytochrome P450 [Crassisporium funariophilum]